MFRSFHIDLNGEWELLERPLEAGPESAGEVAAAPTDWPALVPGDVSDALVRAGELPEPLVGLNFRRFPPRVTERSWWYRKRLTLPDRALEAAAVELHLDGLDIHGDIFLNGVHLGHHDSAFLPFVREARGLLRQDDENVLLVRLTTGAERVRQRTDCPLLEAVPDEAQRGYPDRSFAQRIFLRKPAYTWGWDWSPHLPTCGITGCCWLRCSGVNDIGQVFLRPTLRGRRARVQITAELHRHTLTSTAWGRLTVRLTDEQGRAHEATADGLMLRSGLTIVPLELEINSPRLWWPNGSGAQHRYTVSARLETEEGVVELAPFRWGLRTVEMDNRPGLFRFRINGQPLFIQGGNWVPCDHLYGRTTPERLEHLVAEAANANFNCLRVWGGGRFELDAFYEASDRHGILLWHDFMSACAPLPADDPAFADLFCREARYQVRRLHNRACLLLWCGNNEVGACYEWFKERLGGRRDPAWALYFERLPALVHTHAPHLLYWPTSPYGGSKSVNDSTVGDDHHWVVMRPREEFWSNPEYWDQPAVSIFNSEYGYGGPCSLASTQAYLGTDQPDLFGEVARQHTNTFYNVPRVNFSIRTHYRDPQGLSLDEYILYGGLCQGLNLGYSLESMRANEHTWGGIFWMYDDAWGENGWSIIDHYLRRKVAYYNVRRCLAPQRLVLRRGGQAFGGRSDEVVLIAINAGPAPLRHAVRLGYFSYDGSRSELRPVQVRVDPRSCETVATCPVPTAQLLTEGMIVAIPVGRTGLEPAIWRHGTYRDAAVPPANVRIRRVRRHAGQVQVSVTADGFVHAVQLNVGDDAHPSDQYFDLPAGCSRTITVPEHELPVGWKPQLRWVNLPPPYRSHLFNSIAMPGTARRRSGFEDSG